jgi:hypothetical protein
MARFEFSLVIEGADILTRESLDALFEAGCDDATFGAVDSAQYVDFSRQAPSLEAAIPGAIDQVEKAIPGARVIRVEPDDLVTAAEIGQRLGRTRESVRLLISGRRGPGGFPPPSSHLKARGRLWRWAEVDAWAKEAIGWTGRSKDATFIAAINAALELRRLAPRLEEARQRRAIAGILSMVAED